MERNLGWFAEVYELKRPSGEMLPVADWPAARVLRGEMLADELLRPAGRWPTPSPAASAA
jgi:hypothetical protein